MRTAQRTTARRLTLTDASAIRAVRKFARAEGIRPHGRALAVIVQRFVGHSADAFTVPSSGGRRASANGSNGTGRAHHGETGGAE